MYKYYGDLITPETHPNARVYQHGKELDWVFEAKWDDTAKFYIATQYHNDGNKVIVTKVDGGWCGILEKMYLLCEVRMEDE